MIAELAVKNDYQMAIHAIGDRGNREVLNIYEEAFKRHPEKKAEIYNPYTVVKRQGDGFTGVPYHIQYQKWLGPAAAALKDAARLSGDPHFADLRSRNRLRGCRLCRQADCQADQ